MTSKIKYSTLKRALYLCLLLICPLLSVAQNDASALFEQGNAQYAKGKYKDAINTYQKILSWGYQSETVYFNLGNAYYKTDEIASALLYYEKARKLAPGDDDINFNIQLTNLKTTDKIDEAPQFFILKWWDSFILMFSVKALSTMAILLLIAGFGTLTYYLFAQSSSLKKISFYTALALIFLGLTNTFMANRQVNYFASHQEAIIFGGTVNVHSEPTPTSKNLFVIHEGTKVDVTTNNNGWLKVKLPNGNEGWIQGGDAKEI